MRRDRRGMTLIEAMIAIAILGMVATMVWTGFSQTSRNKSRVEREIDHYQIVRAAMERMARELSMAYVSAHRNPSQSLVAMNTAFVGTDRGGRDRVDFTSFSHQRLYRDAHESDQNEISYFVTRHPDRSRDDQVLVRREQNRVDDDPQRGGRIEVMVENVEEFELEYLDPGDATGSPEWRRTWNTTQGAEQPNRLPAQVKIRLTINHWRSGRRQTFGTRAVLPMVHALNHAIYNP